MGLADSFIVHTDIRPGFDVTSNVMFDINKVKNKMYVIDFESLALWFDSNRQANYDPRYPVHRLLQREDGPLVYVFQQALGVIAAWVLEIDAPSFKMIDALEDCNCDVSKLEASVFLKSERSKWFTSFSNDCKENAINGKNNLPSLLDYIKPKPSSRKRKVSE